MKITKTASGKTKIVLNKQEWKAIGKKAGWMKKSDHELIDFDTLEMAVRKKFPNEHEMAINNIIDGIIKLNPNATLEEALRDLDKYYPSAYEKPCSHCSGTGSDPQSSLGTYPCKNCKGSGKVK